MGTPYLAVNEQPDSQNNLPRCGTPTNVSRTPDPDRVFAEADAWPSGVPISCSVC
jgi:hypothetical protein